MVEWKDKKEENVGEVIGKEKRKREKRAENAPRGIGGRFLMSPVI